MEIVMVAVLGVRRGEEEMELFCLAVSLGYKE
jgi:hypothetical protein